MLPGLFQWDPERVRQLREALAGMPLDPADDDAVLAAIETWDSHDGQLTGLQVWEYLGWQVSDYVAWLRARPCRVSPDEARWSPVSG